MQLTFRLIKLGESNRAEYRCEELSGKIVISAKLFDGLPPATLTVEADNFVKPYPSAREAKDAYRQEMAELRDRLNNEVKEKRLTRKKMDKIAREDAERAFAAGVPAPPT